MSRKATFEGFFPAAPSVQQQKRKRAALERERLEAAGQVVSNDAFSPQEVDAPFNSHGSKRQRLSPNDIPPDQNQAHSESAEVSNGVGSASSYNSSLSCRSDPSTRSSQNGNSTVSYNQTPLTIPESSPAGKLTPQSSKSQTLSHAVNGFELGPPPTATQNGQELHPTKAHAPAAPVDRPQARPSLGNVKGEKAVYDPDLDRKLTSKERRNPHLKTRYTKFGEKVRLIVILHIWALSRWRVLTFLSLGGRATPRSALGDTGLSRRRS